MPDPELERLRRDLDEMKQRIAGLSSRLVELETRQNQAVPLTEPPIVSKPPDSTAPPPVRAPFSPSPYTAALRDPAGTESGLQVHEEIAPAEGYEPPSLVVGAVERYFQNRIEDIKKLKREVGWEVLLGTYWLPRIAVLCIAIAVVFFLSLAIQRWGGEWLPHLRVGIGYSVAAVLMLLAWRSERKYGGFARVMYGGGFAVMYFVTFATHYSTFARVFTSPAPTLVLLAVIVLAWAIAAQITIQGPASPAP